MIPFTNEEIADFLEDLAFLSEIEGTQNPFKIRSYYKAAESIRLSEKNLFSLNENEWNKIPGIGTGIHRILSELKSRHSCHEMEELLQKIPETLLELREIKGLGPARIRTLWKEVHIKNFRELVKALEQNKLHSVKGLGEKFIEQLHKNVTFLIQSKQKKLYKQVIAPVNDFLMQARNYDASVQISGNVYACMPVLESIDFYAPHHQKIPTDFIHSLEQKTGLPVHITDKNPLHPHEFIPGTSVFVSSVKNYVQTHKESANELFDFLKNLPPEWHDRPLEQIHLIKQNDIVTYEDICGLIHAHSTWSDGQHSMEEMAKKCMENGWEWMVISDHSKSAFYANGLNEDRIQQQRKEIDKLNSTFKNFRIFHGIECDILPDGELDFSYDTLKMLDAVIISVHSKLNMKEDEVTHRLIKAIEKPGVHILGHPTGRLLLQREGYPVNHRKIIDACAANGVAIELNATPWRLDLDYTWIEYCMKKEVMMCISPDAHSIQGISDVEYGTVIARKGLMEKKFCLNTFSSVNFLNWLQKKHGHH